MDFFDRKEETEELRRLRDLSEKASRFTVLTGRRRVGKTELLHHALGDRPYIYWLVTRSAERELCATMQGVAEDVLGVRLPGRADSFIALFRWVMQEAARRPITLIIDEFQEFFRVNQSVFSEMAGVWDALHKEARINLVVCGSVNRLMGRIFFDEGEPLYGRNTGRIMLEPFRISVLKDILAAHSPGRRFAPDDLLTLWALTGGVARYVEQLMDEGAVTRDGMLEATFRRSSPVLDEGRAVLVQEFGKDYGNYFSILSAVAGGDTSYGAIKNAVGVDPGAYLSKLEFEYGILEKKLPFKGLSSGKQSLYKIEDRFFRFWFRFVYKYQYLIEMGRFAELLKIVRRDFDAYSGEALESYFRARFKEDTTYTRIGGWWDRKGENEIDLVCEDELQKRLRFIEVKRDRRDISVPALKAKAEAFFRKTGMPPNGWTCEYNGLSLEDM
jgi:AAA+ ATPase superfamily predicted ATPase